MNFRLLIEGSVFLLVKDFDFLVGGQTRLGQSEFRLEREPAQDLDRPRPTERRDAVMSLRGGQTREGVLEFRRIVDLTEFILPQFLPLLEVVYARDLDAARDVEGRREMVDRWGME